ncbi:MAG TPA: hypothetical protein PLF40_30935 [Kofleriaceae bacterium]|nr:hypothetical protein [Kofleriaceae bacterium]
MKHGGARDGAGRKRSTNEQRQRHWQREKFTKRCLQITLKMKPDIKNLRRRDVYRKIEDCLRKAAPREDAQICDVSVQGGARPTAVSRGRVGASGPELAATV